MISRRNIFLLAGASALACGGEAEDQMNIPPWHMWGSDQQFTAQITAGSVPGKAAAQLAQVNYRRPDTWRFLLYATVDGVVTVDTGDLQIDVFFDLTLGVGRSTAVLNNFAHLQWTVNNVSGVGMGQTFFLTEAVGPPRIIAEAANQNRIQTLSAQSIQVAARVQVSAGAPWTVNGRAGALFTPNHHVRPEWFKQQFPGGEDAQTGQHK